MAFKGQLTGRPIECLRSHVSTDRGAQVLDKIKNNNNKKKTGKCLQGPGSTHTLNFNSVMESLQLGKEP